MSSAYLRCSLAAAAMLSAATAVSADPVPVFTFYEEENPTGFSNDTFEIGQVIDASVILVETGSLEAHHRFFLSGSLQSDCVWGRSPRLGLQVLGSPLQAHDSQCNSVSGTSYEPVLATSTGAPLLGVAPQTNPLNYRLAIGAFGDVIDGTVNGLVGSSPHLETGSGRVTIHYRDAGGASLGEDSYDFTLRGGADAVRITFMAPSQTATADIFLDDKTGVQEICYDVDFFELRALESSGEYRVSVLGGRTPSGDPTPLQLGFFDAAGQLVLPFTEYGEFTTTSDGKLYIGVTGAGDGNFNGLLDSIEDDFFSFLGLLNQFSVDGHPFVHTPGASVKNVDTAQLVNRYPHHVWEGYASPQPFLIPSPLGPLDDGEAPESLFQHGVCGEYVLMIEYLGTTDSNPCPADLIGDGFVGSGDLAVLLGSWGPCP